MAAWRRVDGVSQVEPGVLAKGHSAVVSLHSFSGPQMTTSRSCVCDEDYLLERETRRDMGTNTVANCAWQIECPIHGCLRKHSIRGGLVAHFGAGFGRPLDSEPLNPISRTSVVLILNSFSSLQIAT